jgi:hypothetical protein
MPFAEALRLVNQGEIDDAKSIVAILLAASRVPALKPGRVDGR